jgi:predicted amino acid dehydrogenase
MNQDIGEEGMYSLMDFLHLSSVIDLQLLAAALRPLVGSDFVPYQDSFVKSMASVWDRHEVIIAHPLSTTAPDYTDTSSLNEHNSATNITIAVKGTIELTDDVLACQSAFAAAIATTLAASCDIEVLHSRSWQIERAHVVQFNRRYDPNGSLIEALHPTTFSSGWKRIALATSIESLRPKYEGPLDFIFVVHPRSVGDKRRPFPIMRGLDNERILSLVPSCTILSPIEVQVGDRLLRGELVSIPHEPGEMFDRLPEARAAVIQIFDYAVHRNTKMVGLGALIPSITRHGKLLSKVRPHVPFTTGHGFTALTIARMVEDIEDEIGSNGLVAVIGAAGSTGRAALRCMFKRRPSRNVLAVDLALQLSKIPQIPGWNPKVHRLTSFKDEIKDASIVVCVTNAINSILEADDFGPNTVVLDDAQPENVTESVLLARPDLRVVKCLARIPGLFCPFDMGLFTADNRDDEVSFTCLAETILLAAEDHSGSFVVGDPTDDQFEYLDSLALRHRFTPANFYSFPGVGPVNLHSLDRN